jgi:predicted ATPase
MNFTRVKEVYVDGYKNLIDCKAVLGDFNVIVGPNNSGKSNFLEIFQFLLTLIFGSEDFRNHIFKTGQPPRGYLSSCALMPYLDKPITISFLVETSQDGQNIKHVNYSISAMCASAFRDQKKRKNYGFVSEVLTIKDKNKTGKAITLIKRKGESIMIRTKKGRKTFQIESIMPSLPALRMLFPKKRGLDEDMMQAMNAVLDVFATKVLALEPDELRKNLDQKKLPEGLKITSFDIMEIVKKLRESEKTFRTFERIICDVLDVDNVAFKKIEIDTKEQSNLEGPPEVHFFGLSSRGTLSPLANLSDGTLMVIGIVAMMLASDKEDTVSPIICIEEPENCLHPKALKALLSYMMQKSLEKQILITTHSPYILNMVYPKNVIVARIRQDGSTNFERIQNIRQLNKRLKRGFVSFGDLLETEFEDEEVEEEVNV